MATGQQIVDKARSALGVSYVWGGNSLSSGVDCSGLVQQVYKAFGINLPRVTYQQIGVGASVPLNKLRAGDLVFFDTDRSRKGPDHVGIYVGGGKFIHAPKPGDRVKISSLADSYYQGRWMGGRRVPGIAGGSGGDAGYAGPQGASVAPYAAPRLDADELAETYGMSYSFFKSQPELFKLLKEAVKEQWSPTKFQAHVKNSGWWKKNSKTVREAQVLAKTDPATYKATLEANRVLARQLAVKMGAVLSEKNVDKLAKNITRLGWNEAQIGNFLGSYVKFQADQTLGGAAGAAEKAIRGLAYDLGVSVTKQSVLNNAQYLVKGITTMEKIQASMRQQSAGLYPAFADQISAGASMRDLAQPYVQVLADELRMPDTDINMFTPKIKSALNRMNAKGEPEPMTISEFQRFVRSDPKWNATPGAANQTMAVGRQVLSDMGLVR